MKKVFELIKADLNLGKEAIEAFANEASGFFGGFHNTLNRSSTKEDSLTLLLSWANHALEIEVSIAENNVGRNANVVADAAEKAALASGASKDEALAIWNAAKAEAKAIPADMTKANEISALIEEIKAELRRA